MPLSTAQKATLKAHIAANVNTVAINGVPTAINAVPASPDNCQAIANWYNLEAAPDFWVWKTSVTKDELVGSAGPDGTTFSWTGAGYITRSQGERDAFRDIFSADGAVNPSLASVRTAFGDIFSGNTAPAPANRTHLLAMSRRKATNAEKLFANGTGSTASPATMAVVGAIDGISDVLEAMTS